ncbi:DUF6879 family protein [Streptomyces sp. NPDC051217]|uniref:DUF6879 family protein n=1 Tax=Streptomyces sp. NPDC051217 TaxID=3365644 RepID=UPI0037B56193
MPDRKALTLSRARGDILATGAYQQDFRRRDQDIIGRNGWKFERRQHFEEQDSPSWDAIQRGEWQEALQLLWAKSDMWERVAREDREGGSVFRRVRVVEEPLTPYLQWELHALRVQGASGMPVRVVSAEKVRSLESSELLPEVVSLGGQVLYEVLYTESGLLDGAVRFQDPGLIGNWEVFIQGLYEDGEDIVSYVDRRVAHLPAPAVKTE